MASYSITTTQNITALTGKAGGDTYSINGGTLIIDSDTRYGPNTSVSTGPFGGIGGSATLGGNITITGGNVRLIPYSLGAGVVPASGTTISRNGVSAELLCVMANRTGGTVTAAGGVMPASGWIKVRNVTGGAFSDGLMTGITATASGPDETGWIEVVGVETLALTINRLNICTMAGEWFSVGTTNGTRGQTMQLPAFDAITEYPGVEIETAPGSGVYKFWANAGQKATSANLGTDSRSRMVWVSSPAVLKIGQGVDGSACMDLPVSGCNVRVPNIVFSTCTAANKAINATPNTTIGSRYEIATNASGNISITRVTGSWYFNLQQAYAITINDLHTCDQSIISECTSAPQVNGWHVGLSNNATPYSSNPIVVQQCYGGGSLANVSGLRAEGVSTAGYSVYFVNLYGGFTLTNVRGAFASDVTAISGAIFFNTCENFTGSNFELIGKRMLVSACTNFALSNIYYADGPKQTTPTTAATHVVEVMSNSRFGSISNIYNWPGVANVHPYTGCVYANTAFDITVRGVGTSAAPFDGGTANKMGYLFSDGGNNGNIRFQRNWLQNLRLGIGSSTNSSTKMQFQNCYNVDASLTQGPNQLNSTWRGNRQNSGTVPTSYTHVDGTHFWDAFTGDTTARAAVVMNEKTSYSGAAYTVDAGAPKFTSGGAAVFASVGDRITWTWTHFILGWNALTTFAATGTNATTNHTIEYDIDKGAGFSGTYKTLSNANLAAETGISQTTGFKPRIRVTCSIANTGNQLTSITINGSTTLALQNAALYPLDVATLNLTGLLTGSVVAVFATASPAAGMVPLASGVATGSAMSLSYSYDSAATTYTLRVRKAGYDPVDLQFANSIAVTIPVAQQENKDGYGVSIYGRGMGATDSFVTVDGPALRVDIGNQLVVAEDLYDVVSAWQATATGITYPECLRFDGRDVLMVGSWRLRRAIAAYTSAGIDAAVVVDGIAGASPDDEANGSVDIRSRAVRTYQVGSGQSAITEAGIAAAVRAELAMELARIDVATSTRLAATDYLAPTLAQIEASTILAKEATVSTRATQTSVSAIPTTPLLAADTRLDNLDTAISTRLATSGYTAPANADIAAIKAKTDTLVNTDTSALALQASVAALGTPMQAGALVEANITQVNGLTVNGAGTELDPWGP
jgi:plastocyanin